MCRGNALERQVSRYRVALCGQWGLLALLLSLVVVDPASFAGHEALIYPMCILFLGVFIWSIVSWKLATGSLFDPYVLFLIAAAVFNGGQVFLEVFHLNERGLLDGRFSSETLFTTLHLVLTALVTLHLGALVSAGTMRKSSPKGGSLPETRVDTRVVGWVLVLVSLVPTAIYLRSCLRTVMSQGYLGLYLQGFPTGLESISRVLAIFLAPGALFLLAGSRGMLLNKIIASVLLLVFSATSFFIGDRGGGGYPLLAFAWLWHKTIRPLSAWKVIVFVLVIMMVLPLVGSIRTTSGEDRASLAFIRDAFLSLDNPIVAIIGEMGASMRTVGYTIELVPSERNYDYGLGYLRATMTLVPSLYWAMTETYSTWLVWIIAPAFARLGGGMGLSFIAEAYANFGWFGTLVFTFILGLLFARLVLWADSSEDVARKALMASFLVFFIAYSRGESAGEIGRLFWAAFVPYLAVKRLRYLRLRARNEPCMHT